MKPRIHEAVSLGHDTIGHIRQTDRGFELFDADDRYIATETTLQGARRALFERHRNQQEAVRA